MVEFYRHDQMISSYIKQRKTWLEIVINFLFNKYDHSYKAK